MSPPKVPLIFRVGIVGHRPNRLEHADATLLSDRLNQLLSSVKRELSDQFNAQPTLYAATTPVLRAISPLAEGVDRNFADQALQVGCELCVVLPFVQSEFEQDF